MSDYLFQDPDKVNLDHPDAAIRLASVVHRFRVPKIASKSSSGKALSFATSFRTAGRHDKTRRLLTQADDCRARLLEGTQAAKISSERVVAEARRYIPHIHNILV